MGTSLRMTDTVAKHRDIIKIDPPAGRRVVLSALGASFLKSACTLKVEPIGLDTARRIIEDGGFENGILSEKFGELIADALDVDLVARSGNRTRVNLRPGDEAIVVSVGGFIDPARDYSARQLEDMAESFELLHITVTP